MAPGKRARDERGSAMVLMVLVTTLCMIFVGTSIGLSASNIRPSAHAADTAAALAAAQAGVDEFALAVEQCGEAAGCAGIAGTEPVWVPTADGAPGRAAYTWDVLETPDMNIAKVLRVAVTGQVGDRAAGELGDVTRTLVADFKMTATLLDYAMFTEIETASPQDIATYYAARTVPLPDIAIRAKANLIPSQPSSVTWSGAKATDICEHLWYDTPATEYGPGRAQLRGLRGLAEGVDYTETTTSPGGASSVLRKDACEVPYGTSFITSGSPNPAQVYSKDALLYSRLVTGGAGPRARAPILTEWDEDSVPAPATPLRWWRSDAKLGGEPYTGSIKPTLAVSPLALPRPVADIGTAAQCVFTGPTRIVLTTTTVAPIVTTATVTSPGTPSLAAKCGAGTSPVLVPPLIAPGLVKVPIPVTASTVFYVKDGPAAPPASATNPLFNLRKAYTSSHVTGQTKKFYDEMKPIATVEEKLLAAPNGATIESTLTPWLNELNAAIVPAINSPQYSMSVAGTLSASPTTVDAVYERSRLYSVVQRKVCTKLFVVPPGSPPRCETYSALATAFTANREAHTFPRARDVTLYQGGLGTAFIEGKILGNLTVVTDHDIVVTEDITYASTTASMVGLVAGNGRTVGADVEIYHPVGCFPVPVPPIAVPGQTCPNDITGLYSPLTAVPLTDAAHPSKQYTNLVTSLRPFTLNGVILVANGALTVQNPMRGTELSTLTLNGAVYQRHRGMLAAYYGPTSVTSRSGYTLSVNYDLDLLTRQPPSFSDASADPDASTWQILGVAERLAP